MKTTRLKRGLIHVKECKHVNSSKVIKWLKAEIKERWEISRKKSWKGALNNTV